MILLKQCDRICIVAEESELSKESPRLWIVYQNKLYNSKTFASVSNPNEVLYSVLQQEYSKNIADAERVLAELKKAKPTPQPQPQKPSGVGSKLEEILMKTIAEQSVDSIVEMAKPMLEGHIIKTFGILPQVHEVKTSKATHKVEGVVHECFDKVLALVNANIPVFLSGPAGTGKNVICKQIAEGLGLDFYFTNAVTQEYQLKGFIDANGKYHETQFYKAFTKGGLFFLDEMDGSIPETLIILNAAIANGYFDFPTGKLEASPDFRVIAAGNTIGTGADIEYTGRFQLDASSLDRFALVNVDYSPAIERAVTNNNLDLCSFAKTFRAVTAKAGIRCLCTYRAMERISKLEGVFALEEVIQIALTKGLRKDDLNVIIKGFVDQGIKNKYVEALKKIE